MLIVLDAMKGYHKCVLNKESQLLTTFITAFGRFKYLCVPYGICSISEHYDCHMAEVFADLSGFHRIVDDIRETLSYLALFIQNLDYLW